MIVGYDDVRFLVRRVSGLPGGEAVLTVSRRRYRWDDVIWLRAETRIFASRLRRGCVDLAFGRVGLRLAEGSRYGTVSAFGLTVRQSLAGSAVGVLRTPGCNCYLYPSETS